MRSVIRPFVENADRTVPALLVVFVLFWTAYSALSRYNLDIHGDMVENYAWGIAWQFGYYKHPPLFSWIAAAWFELFPRKAIFYHLLASVNVGVALAALWRLSRRFLDANQQILLLVTAFFLPPLTFLSANYNATSAMLPFWALTLLFYVRTLERRHVLDALLTGVFAGLAMLVKYHSVVLVMALGAHLLIDRRVRPLLASPLPWVAVAAGLLVMAPHLVWLFEEDFPTLRYAAHQGDVMVRALVSAVRFVPMMLLYSIPAFVVLAAFRRRGDGLPLFSASQLAALRGTVAGRAVIAALILPVVFTIVLAVVTEGTLSSLWTLPFFALLPLAIVLCLPREAACHAPSLGLPILAAYCSILLAIAPFAMASTLAKGRSSSATPLAAIATEAQEAWRDHTGTRLAIVAGVEAPLVNAFAFYASDRPFAVQAMSLRSTPWVTRSTITRDGALAICAVSDGTCTEAVRGLLGRIDQSVPLSVPAVAGSGGSKSWDYTLHLRRPG